MLGFCVPFKVQSVRKTEVLNNGGKVNESAGLNPMLGISTEFLDILMADILGIAVQRQLPRRL